VSIFAADFGGTNIRLGVVEHGRILASHTLNTPAGIPLAQQLPGLMTAMQELATASATQPEAIVWAIPCLVAPDQTTITRTFGKFDDAPQLDLTSWAREKFDLPILLELDAQAAALGEWKLGAGRGVDDLVMITLGTGIGTSAIIDGHPLSGRSGLAGNLGGHNIIQVDGRPCPCGLHGCVETLVATWALPAIAKQSPLFTKSSLATVPRIDYLAVFTHAQSGDPLAKELQDRALAVWAAMIINLTLQFDPARIIVGGGIMASKDTILPTLHKLVNQQIAKEHQDIPITAAELGNAAALAGCEQLWLSLNTPS
jgi:glucokinase